MTAQALPQRASTLQGGGRPALALIAAGVIAAVVLVIGFATDPERAFHAYLAALAFVLSMVLGCIAFVMISHAANATWPVAVRRLPESMAATMPWLALLFVPVFFGLHELYPWMHPEAYPGHTQHVLEHRRTIMTPALFGIRAVLYLAVWSGLGFFLHRWSLAMERGADPDRCARRLRRLSYAGLPIAALCAGFAAYDWFMSLSAELASTMFSALWIAICLHAGVATTVVLLALAGRSRARPSFNDSHAYALGRLLFAFLVFLGYTAFFQFMLIWMANRPGAAAWYLERSEGGYAWVAGFLIVGELALPFFVLLSYRIKRSARRLAPIAAYCLITLYVHINWLITPAAEGSGWSWLDPVAVIAVLGLIAGFVLLRMRGAALAPIADPRYPESLEYNSR